MRRIDFIISNDSHHAAMFEPIIRFLVKADDGLEIRVLSLCEFRGLETPRGLFVHGRIAVRQVLRSRVRRTAGSMRSGGSASGIARRVARTMSWRLLLRRRIQESLQTRPDLVVLPNDAAFPYQLICRLLNERRIPFILVQEGIRFPMPDKEGDEYGKNGAVGVAAWGENSAEFFRSQGVPEERIFITGNPRYDTVLSLDRSIDAARLKNQLGLGGKNLLLLTNPIDAQGFCSTHQKMCLIRAFVDRLEPMFSDSEFTLIVKPHGGEDLSEYERLVLESAHPDRIKLVQAEGLYSLLVLADAAVVIASTVGLESILFGCPLGVLEIPGHGFAHDYVQSGSAIGLSVENSVEDKVALLFQNDSDLKRVAREYLHRNLASVGTSAEQISKLLLKQLEVSGVAP